MCDETFGRCPALFSCWSKQRPSVPTVQCPPTCTLTGTLSTDGVMQPGSVLFSARWGISHILTTRRWPAGSTNKLQMQQQSGESWRSRANVRGAFTSPKGRHRRSEFRQKNVQPSYFCPHLEAVNGALGVVAHHMNQL